MSIRYVWSEDASHLVADHREIRRQLGLIRRTLVVASIAVAPLMAWWTWNWPARGAPNNLQFTLLQSASLSGLFLSLAALTYLHRLRKPNQPRQVEVDPSGVKIDAEHWPWAQVTAPAMISRNSATTLRITVGTWRNRKVHFVHVPRSIDPAELTRFIDARTQTRSERLDLTQGFGPTSDDIRWIATISIVYYLGLTAYLTMGSPKFVEPVITMMLLFANPAWIYALLAEPRTKHRIAGRSIGVMCAYGPALALNFAFIASRILKG